MRTEANAILDPDLRRAFCSDIPDHARILGVRDPPPAGAAPSGEMTWT